MQLPSVIDMKEVGESALEAALPWDRIQGSPFNAWHDERPVIALPSLVSEESTREQHDPDYRYLVDDVAALNKVRAEKTLSLNLKVRQEERTQLDKERLERANQRLIAEGQPPVKSVEELDSGEAVAGDGADGSAASAGSAAKRSTKNGAPSSANAPPDLVLGEATQGDGGYPVGQRAESAPARDGSNAANRQALTRKGLSAAARGTDPRCLRSRHWACGSPPRLPKGAPASTSDSPSETDSGVGEVSAASR